MKQGRHEPEENLDAGILFDEGRNCTTITRAHHASILVDCANYYRDLHESLTKAKHSIFITGWDIDSRIELIRREQDRVHDTPVTLYDLLTLKARQNPEMQIYLNKWDYAFFMAEVREPLSVLKWRKDGLPNIHYCHDGMLPAGACHHQKIIVVDDEVAFCGGMDVAIARWDTRDHLPDDPRRVDPGGLFNPNGEKKFNPYHDIQTVVSGAAAQELAKISRERWYAAAGYEAIPLRSLDGDANYGAWPDTDPPDFENIPVAIARTLPPYDQKQGRFEIEEMYLDEIAAAENFIYMENQYYTSQKLAEALNKRLLECPNLRVLLVSSYDPQGFIEKVSMWSGRIRFKKTLEKGGCASRVTMAYPNSRARGEGDYATVRIHSKIMATDDRFLSVGSANLNNRSMRLDTECDLVYRGETDAQRRKIEDVRNDLIHEHSGYSKDHVAQMINEGELPLAFLKEIPGTRKALKEIDDSVFFGRFPHFLSAYLADPVHSWIPELLPLPSAKNSYMQYLTRRRIFIVLAFFMMVAALAAVWNSSLGQEFGSRERLIEMFENVRNMPMAIPAAIGIYLLCSIFFIPITILTGATAVIFGYWQGLLISLCGSLLSATIGYWLGRGLDNTFKKLLSGPTMERIKHHAQNSNVIAITFLRMLPVAPFTAINIALGMLHVPFLVFLAATFFGLLPGKIIGVFLADSLAGVWRNPNPEQLAYAGLGIGAWFTVVWLTYYFHKLWQKRHKRSEA